MKLMDAREARRKLFVAPTSKWVLLKMRTLRVLTSTAVAGAMTIVASWPVAPVAAQALDQSQPRFESAREAYEQGGKAYRDGNLSKAIPALRYASGKKIFLAKFYLAEILADTESLYEDPEEAYKLYSEIIRDNADVDPKYDYKAPFVARAYVMKSRYLSGELEVRDVRRSPYRARRLLGYAATYLDDPNAQYEYARMLLEGRGGERNVRGGKHYLSLLSRKGHAGAQAYLADLFWTGKYVKRHVEYALALSTLAARNSPTTDDRIWIDELHHEIYCATEPGVHAMADKLILRWLARYPTRRIHPRGRTSSLTGPKIRWACADGNNVNVYDPKDKSELELEPEVEAHKQSDTVVASPAPVPPRVGKRSRDHDRLFQMHGSVLGFRSRGGTGTVD